MGLELGDGVGKQYVGHYKFFTSHVSTRMELEVHTPDTHSKGEEILEFYQLEYAYALLKSMWMCIPGKFNCVILCLQILDYAFDRMGVDGAEVIKHC